MADEEQRMEKHRDMEGEKMKGQRTPTRAVAQNIPESLPMENQPMRK